MSKLSIKSLFTNKNKAWTVLKSDEQMALLLKHVENKSTWEAGEILKKSHYKYLEIVQRAEKFFKMFTWHYQEYDTLFPSFLEVPVEVEKYFNLCLFTRCSANEAWRESGQMHDDFATRKNKIIDLLERLRLSPNPELNYFYHLVMDFDRYNNWRILPEEIQEPHAFKRRQKSKQKKYLIRSLSLTDDIVHLLSNYTEYNPKPKDIIGYTYVMGGLSEEAWLVIPYKITTESLMIAKRYHLFIFKKEEDVNEYVKRTIKYFLDKSVHRIREGQRYWPFYRNYTKKAHNYKELFGIEEERIEFLSSLSNKPEMTRYKKSMARENDIDD